MILRWVVNGYLKNLGYYRDGLSCHALRHSHAAHAVAAGADLVAVSHELVHRSLDATTPYMHVVDAVKQNPAAVLLREGGSA
jgi:site-specific recombinase XerD